MMEDSEGEYTIEHPRCSKCDELYDDLNKLRAARAAAERKVERLTTRIFAANEQLWQHQHPGRPIPDDLNKKDDTPF